ncbi:MAG: 4-hydroxythreonine-4-phosphate dehydrogenase PdxA [Orrella sp.]
MTNATIGITMGDPAGIGPEILLKLFQAELSGQCVVYGDTAWLKKTAARLALPVTVQSVTHLDELAPQERGIMPVIQACDEVPPSLSVGKASAQAGMAAYQCLQTAIDDALAHKLQAIVTAPLNKHAIHLAGIDFPGHTEILSHRCGDVPVAMMLVNDDIRVLLVTIHTPLANVASLITPALEQQAIALAHQAGQQLGLKNPRIAVAGLNPHAGEQGRFGQEEMIVIEPAITAAREKGMNVSGPWPGDTVFSRARAGEFDIVVAQYHDQGLIPVKYLGIEQGVNVTVGLPFVRTSVDHGTAFDIAHLGTASPDSLWHAVKLANQLASAGQ